jgi:small subunit ribosomal protein S2
MAAKAPKAVSKEVVEKKVENTAYHFPELKEMLEAGVHFGHSVKRRNPRMDEYVYAVKNGVQIFDLIKTHEKLKEACDYLKETVAKGGSVLLVGSKGQAAPTIKAEAERIGVPYISTRWIGGLFTNWEMLKGRVNRLIEMRKAFETGAYSKYTKKEQVVLKKEMDRLDRMYGGVVTLKDLPKVIFIVDPTRETTALHESLLREIPVVAICDSNCNPDGITKVIPANDDALKSVVMLVTAVTHAVEEGLMLAKRAA